MSQHTFKSLVLVVLIATALILAVVAGPAAAQNVACYMSQGGASWVAGSGCTWNVKSGGTLQVDSGGAVTWDGLTVKPSVNSSTSSVVNNTKIAHGLGTTPTTILLSPFYAGTFTQTVYISATNATSFTVGIGSGSVTTLTTLYWEASK